MRTDALAVVAFLVFVWREASRGFGLNPVTARRLGRVALLLAAAGCASLPANEASGVTRVVVVNRRPETMQVWSGGRTNYPIGAVPGLSQRTLFTKNVGPDRHISIVVFWHVEGGVGVWSSDDFAVPTGQSITLTIEPVISRSTVEVSTLAPREVL